MTKMATLQDPFTEGSLNATLWGSSTGGTTTLSYGEQGVSLNFPAVATSSDAGTVHSQNTYDLTSSYLSVRIVAIPNPATNAYAVIRAEINGSNYVEWYISNGTLSAVYDVTGTVTDITTITYSPLQHAFLRIRESGGTTYWDTSPDGTNWTNQASVADPITETALIVVLNAACYETEISPGQLVFNDFNVFPAIVYPQVEQSGPIRARIPQNAPRGRTAFNKGAPVKNPTPGPVFHPQLYPIRSKIPRHTRTFAGWTAGIIPRIIQLINTAEGGTSGTTASASNTGGGAGAAFDAVSIIANGTLAFDNSEAAHGLLSYKVATGATPGTALLEWSQSLQGPQLTVWYRAYLYYTANPASASSPVEVRAGGSAAALISVNSSGNLELFDGTGTGHDTFASAIPLNSWFRIEGYFTGSPSAGAISCSLYTPKDSMTALESHTVTGVNNTGLITQIWYGEANSGSSEGPLWIDDIGVSNAGYLGPSGGSLPPGDYGFLDGSVIPSLTTTFPGTF